MTGICAEKQGVFAYMLKITKFVEIKAPILLTLYGLFGTIYKAYSFEYLVIYSAKEELF